MVGNGSGPAVAEGGVGWGGGSMYKRQQGENSPHPNVMDAAAANDANVLNGEEDRIGGGSSRRNIEESQPLVMVERKGGANEESSPPINDEMGEEVPPPLQHQQEKRAMSHPEGLAPRAREESSKNESRILSMRLNKLHEEKRRKSEWRVDTAVGNEEGARVVESNNGKQSYSEDKRTPTNKEEDTAILKISLTDNGARIPTSQSSHHGTDPTSQPVSNLLNSDKWWGKQQRRQRPLPTAYEHKGSFFQVHSVSTLAEKTTQASEKVSAESTQSFAHGNEENSLRHRASITSTKSVPSTGSSPSRFFRVHDDAASNSISTKNSMNVALTSHDNRGPGDEKGARTKLIDSSFKSLIEMEARVRPIPSTFSPEHAKVTDHRDVGDETRPRRFQKHSTTDSLVGTEEQIRPGAPSAFPGYAQVKDHRSTGDTRVANRSKLSTLANRSLVEKEGRVRPIVSSSHLPEYTQVRDRRSVGDTRKLAVRSQNLSPLAKSLIEEEESIRPVSSSSSSHSSSIDHNPNVCFINHRGPGDNNALTRRAQQLQPVSMTPSLSESEQRARPIPSSHQFQDIQVGDHRGPGDTNALTKRVESTLSSSFNSDITSLSTDEQRQRPVPTSDLSRFQSNKIGDYRGPGDTSRTITDKLHSSSSPNVVGIEDGCWWDESTQRPTPMGKTVDGSQKQAVNTPNKPSSTLKSLLKEEIKDFLSDRNRKQALTNNPTPIAAIPPSSLHSLLIDDERLFAGTNMENNANPRLHLNSREPKSLSSLSLLSKAESKLRQQQRTRSSSRNEKASSLSSSSANRTDEWWNEKPQRPRNYVKHYQPMIASYTMKLEPPRDYGDVVTASSDKDDFGNTNQ